MAHLISQKRDPLKSAGRTVGFPVIGEAKFSDQGTLEVADDKVEEFIKATEESFDFKIVGTESKPKEKKETIKDKKAKKEKEKFVGPQTDEEKEFWAQLEGTAVKDLLELAGEAGLGAQAAGYTDKKLREELFTKLK